MDHPALNQQLSLFREEMAEDTEEVAKENRLKIPDGSADIGGLLKAVEVCLHSCTAPLSFLTHFLGQISIESQGTLDSAGESERNSAVRKAKACRHGERERIQG